MRSLFVGLFGLALVQAASAQVIWDESIHGDLSGDRLVPTSLNLAPGVNGLIATSVAGDREYVHFHLAPGMRLDAINTISYSGDDQVAFIGVQAGTTFTEPPTGTNVANLLGWTLFGPGMGNMNQNILPQMGVGDGAIGFTPPLTGADYTFWIQQTGDLTAYRLDFVTTVVPEPASLVVLAIGGLAIRLRRRA